MADPTPGSLQEWAQPRRLARLVLIGVGLGLIVWLVAFGAGVELPGWFAGTTGLLVVALYGVVRAVVDSAGGPDVEALPVQTDLPVTVAAIGPLESRLSGSSHSWRVYRTRLRPMLVDLAAERLRRRHGVDVDLDPEEARAVLGDDLWTWMTEPLPDADARTRGPSAATLDRLLKRIEAI